MLPRKSASKTTVGLNQVLLQSTLNWTSIIFYTHLRYLHLTFLRIF